MIVNNVKKNQIKSSMAVFKCPVQKELPANVKTIKPLKQRI